MRRASAAARAGGGWLSEVARPLQRGLLGRVGISRLAARHLPGHFLHACECSRKKPIDHRLAHLGNAIVADRSEAVDEDKASDPVGLRDGQVHRQVHAPPMAEHDGLARATRLEYGDGVGNVGSTVKGPPTVDGRRPRCW